MADAFVFQVRAIPLCWQWNPLISYFSTTHKDVQLIKKKKNCIQFLKSRLPSPKVNFIPQRENKLVSVYFFTPILVRDEKAHNSM